MKKIMVIMALLAGLAFGQDNNKRYQTALKDYSDNKEAALKLITSVQEQIDKSNRLFDRYLEDQQIMPDIHKQSNIFLSLNKEADKLLSQSSYFKSCVNVSNFALMLWLEKINIADNNKLIDVKKGLNNSFQKSLDQASYGCLLNITSPPLLEDYSDELSVVETE